MRSDERKFLFLGLSLLALALGLVIYSNQSSSKESTETKTAQTVKKAKEEKIEDAHLRDNDTLYSSDDDTSVKTMYLTVRRGNKEEGTDHSWQEINTYSAYDYERMNVERYQVAALLQAGDENGPKPGDFGYGEEVPNATVQVRGQTSSKNKQKNYKIEIKKNKGTWENQRTINLNKHQTEGMRFRNKLSYDLIEDIPQIMGARTQFVHLYVKDETGNGTATYQDYGLYTQVEQINKKYLETHGLDENAHLYKVNFFEFLPYEDTIVTEDNPKFNKKKFEELLEIKGDHDHTKLVDMLKKVNDPSVSVDTLLKKYFDSENIQWWMAYQILMGNDDTQSRNMFLYSPQNSTKWYIIPWDNDSSFLKTEGSFLGKASDKANSWEVGVSNYWGNNLFQRLLKSDDFRKGLDQAMHQLRKQITKERISSMSQKYAEVVKPYLAKMPDQMYAKLSSDEYNQVLQELPNELESNYQDYLRTLKSPQPFFIDRPSVKNNKLQLSWGASYDFNNKDITYTVEVAKDYSFKNKIFEKSGLKTISAEMSKLDKGQYFIRVTATNSDGVSQRAFDNYITDDEKFYGIMSFYVLENGKIREETYEEG